MHRQSPRQRSAPILLPETSRKPARPARFLAKFRENRSGAYVKYVSTPRLCFGFASAVWGPTRAAKRSQKPRVAGVLAAKIPAVDTMGHWPTTIDGNPSGCARISPAVLTSPNRPAACTIDGVQAGEGKLGPTTPTRNTRAHRGAPRATRRPGIFMRGLGIWRQKRPQNVRTSVRSSLAAKSGPLRRRRSGVAAGYRCP
jgi:hypothetical protein